MRVGMLGYLIFEVSDEKVLTFQSAQRSRNIKIQNHDRHGMKQLPEVVGLEPEQATLSIRVSKTLGVNPYTEELRIRTMAETGEPQKLVFGTQPAGSWLIKSYKIKYESFDRKGIPTDFVADLTLVEYPKE